LHDCQRGFQAVRKVTQCIAITGFLVAFLLEQNINIGRETIDFLRIGMLDTLLLA